MTAATWDSLEVTKLIVGVLTPITVVVLGVFIAQAARRVEQNQWANRKIVERRIDTFEEIAPKLNRIYCFYAFVGSWKEVTPDAVVALKREVDETMHIQRILFSPELFDEYQRFMTGLFEMFQERGTDARIRAHITLGGEREGDPGGDRRALDWWQGEYAARFADRALPLDEVSALYSRLADAFRDDLYVVPGSAQ